MIFFLAIKCHIYSINKIVYKKKIIFEYYGGGGGGGGGTVIPCYISFL